MTSLSNNKVGKKIAFLDDEVDGDEIVIRGAIKKSSLKGVHEYLNSEDDEILEKDDDSDI